MPASTWRSTWRWIIIGGQLTLNAFASNFYPAHVRATGTGWALGVGRFGSILGPLFGSLLLAMHIPVEQIFFFCAIPAVIAALLIIQVRAPGANTLHSDVLKPSL